MNSYRPWLSGLSRRAGVSAYRRGSEFGFGVPRSEFGLLTALPPWLEYAKQSESDHSAAFNYPRTMRSDLAIDDFCNRSQKDLILFKLR